MNLDKNKIGIITTVCNWDLYHKTKHFFPKDIQVFAIDGTNSFYGIDSMVFFMKKLKKKDIDWLIMADEDVVFTRPERVFNLINFLAENEYTVSGMSEADRFENWSKHPYVVNTYFCILHLKKIYGFYNEKEMLENQYILADEFSNKKPWMPEYPHKINSLAESYYCFFLWLLRKGEKTKFLSISRPSQDPLTTIVKDHTGKELLFHSWYARFYGKDSFHTDRINDLIKEGKFNNENPNFKLFKNYNHDIKYFFYRSFRRIRRYFVE